MNEFRRKLAEVQESNRQAREELSMMQAGPIMSMEMMEAEEEILYKSVPALLDALHDAIRRPMGVIPDSAIPFVTETDLAAAEERRPRQFDSEPE